MDEASQQNGSRAFAPGFSRAFTAFAALAVRHGAGGAPATGRNPANGGLHDLPDLPPSGDDDATPTLSIRFVVDPDRTVTWKIASDSTLRVCHERIWLTRARSPYDYWLGPGDTFRLARGERIWLSCDAARPAQVTLTSAWSRRRTAALAWIEWFAGWPGGFTPRREL